MAHDAASTILSAGRDALPKSLAAGDQERLARAFGEIVDYHQRFSRSDSGKPDPSQLALGFD